MVLVEVIGLYLANQEAFLNRLKTDMAAAGWTKVDENTKSGSCSFSTVDTTANTFTINNHGFSDGELFQFYTSGTAPSPLTSWNPYYIRDATQNTFKLCSTQGGTAIDLTSKGAGTHYFREYMHAWSSTGENSNKRISYVQFIRAQATSFYVYGLRNVTLENVQISAATTGLVIRNADGVRLKNVRVTAKKGPPFVVQDAQVEGLPEAGK